MLMAAPSDMMQPGADVEDLSPVDEVFDFKKLQFESRRSTQVAEGPMALDLVSDDAAAADKEPQIRFARS